VTWTFSGSTTCLLTTARISSRSIALITSLFCVGLIVAVVLGAWLYVQPPPRDPDAAEPASQSGAVAPPAALGNATSPPHEPPLRGSVTAPSQEPPPLSDRDAAASQSAAVAPPAALGSAIPLPPRRPLQVRIAKRPRATAPPADAFVPM
jgi:hypothetical protein